MIDYGFPNGVIKKFNDTDSLYSGWWGIRRLLWKLLKKLNVAFYDPCCNLAADPDSLPVRWNPTLTRLERYDPDTKAWVEVV